MKDSFDPSINILQRQDKNLDAFFYPKTVALIGATEKEHSVGRTLLWNLLRSPFGGTVYPVNPKRNSVLGIKAYPSVNKIPDDIDLAVIVTPAQWVPDLILECTQKKVKAAVVISAGFKEIGKEGEKLEKKLLQNARKGNMKIIGPNCLGVMSPISGLNATFAADISLKGNIAFISQSGALCTAVLDWSFTANVGFSAFVSIGSMVDVGWGDLISYFGNDPNTKSILIYMESIGNPRAFLSAARQVALSKPIILIKAGRTEESAKAAASHTGSLSGSDDVLNAALKRVGVLRVNTIADLFSMAEVLSKQPLPKGPNLSIITNAGGPGVIATDALIEQGGKLAQISDKTYQSLDAILPPQWSCNNPIDILGDASPDLYAKTIDIVKKDEKNDGILVILTPQDMTDPTKTAEKIQEHAKLDKPILASWMGGRSVKKGAEILNQRDIPTFPYPDAACRAFSYMFQYKYNLNGIYQTPILLQDLSKEASLKRKQEVEKIFAIVRKEKRKLLDEVESKRILEIYNIPVVPTKRAEDKQQAMELAEQMGYPVVLKLYSKTITHKTDVGGVILHINNKEEVAKAFTTIFSNVKEKKGEQHFQGVTVQPMIDLKGIEIIIGSSVDPEFGPVILFGMGGQWVEVFKDKALGLPPLNSTLAERLVEETKVYTLLKGVRGQKGCDVEELKKILIQFSQLIVEIPEIEEFDINPLLASSEHIIALDARIVLQKENIQAPVLAIRPYPLEYIETWKLKEGQKIVIRPIRAEDEQRVLEFHKDLSERTIRQRFLKMVHYDERVAKDRLSRICFNDYDKEIALIVQNSESEEILAISRMSKLENTTASFSMTIKDAYHHQGIGTKLLEKLIHIARKEGLIHLRAEMLKENIEMKGLLEKFAFTLTNIDEQRWGADLVLNFKE